MRIAIGAIIQETNTFSPLRGTLDDFRSIFYLLGEDIPARLRDSSTEISGFYDVLDGTDHEVIPTVAAMSVSSGRLTRETYETLKEELLGRILDKGIPDAVLLALHGAMCIEGEDDGDGALLEELRARVGMALPVFITHDLHANLTKKRVALSNALVGYHTTPHIDHRSTGARAASLLLHTLSTGIKPRNFLRKIPMMAPSVKMNTAIEPLGPIVKRAEELERNPRTPSISPFWMQPWLDVEEAGAAVNVVCYGDKHDADGPLQELGDAIWQTRHQLDVDLWRAREAIQDVISQPGRPCVFADTGDAPPGGAPGDSNHLLLALIAEGFNDEAMLTLTDPRAVKRCHDAGEGAEIELTLGGYFDSKHFTPSQFRGRVKTLSSGRFRYGGPIAKGQEANMGLASVFEIGKIRVLVHERPVYSHDPAVFRAVGLDPLQAKIVVAKSPTQFRACYEPIAHKIYEIETSGVCNVNLRQLNFRTIPRPMYPFDPDDLVETNYFHHKGQGSGSSRFL